MKFKKKNTVHTNYKWPIFIVQNIASCPLGNMSTPCWKYEHPMLIMPDPEGNMSRNIKIFFCLICKLNHLFYKNAGTQWIYVLFCVFGHKSMIPEHLVQKLWLLEVKVLILPHPPLLHPAWIIQLGFHIVWAIPNLHWYTIYM